MFHNFVMLDWMSVLLFCCSKKVRMNWFWYFFLLYLLKRVRTWTKKERIWIYCQFLFYMSNIYKQNQAYNKLICTLLSFHIFRIMECFFVAFPNVNVYIGQQLENIYQVWYPSTRRRTHIWMNMKNLCMCVIWKLPDFIF